MTKDRNRKAVPLVITFLIVLALACLATPAAGSTDKRFGIDGDKFVLDGKPFQIIAGEMHYPRIPREYWRDRLKMARAMGLNTVSTYVFWNLHEPRPGVYDFTGQQDIVTFIRMAQEEGLKVILRPGPYICAEWELGGFPAWLLKNPDTVLRSTDEKFMNPAERWIARLGQEVAKLQIGRGGPIIAVQVENEYGSFDKDKVYMRRVYDALRNAGFTDTLLYTADGPTQLPDGTLPDVPAVVNFGPGQARQGLEVLAKFRPGQPLMIGEWWAGWFDHWGAQHHTTNGEEEAKELDWVLQNGHSINFYMFHGGTSWGFMNGANFDRGGYRPDTSSYDYSAALDESGRPTKKYWLFRDVIAKRTGAKLPKVPVIADTIELPGIKLERTAPLFSNLPKATVIEKPQNMERVGQSYGYILYTTKVKGPVAGELAITDVRDYALVYVDGMLVGSLDRRSKQDRLPVEIKQKDARLDILVENTGRINFTKELRNERKGITKSVTLAGTELTGWQVYPLPMTDLSSLRFTTDAVKGPAFYDGTLDVRTPADTFLDMRNWSKGTVWINGHHLGRFWNIGPQQTMYVPGAWLKKGANRVVVFDLVPQSNPVVKTSKTPVFEVHPSQPSQHP
ncbi:MAG TPA: beta-galactosidase family protein [Terriglobales bacterium]|nr:beta-galactosidase family protein [Terriglobales bacterium]